MKNKYILLVCFLAVMVFIGCQKDASITPQIPTVNELSMEVKTKVVSVEWEVNYPGKLYSIVKISLNSDMSDAFTYGCDTLTSEKKFSAMAVNLTKSTTYYYCYEVWNSFMSYKSDIKSFTTKSVSIPTVLTSYPSEIGSNLATGGGVIIDDGESVVTECGVCWSSTYHAPTATGSHVLGTGNPFTVEMTGLTRNTTYYVRSYAINSEGIAYGNAVEFKTNDYPTGAINGLFSVSENQKVWFSKGNLQYQASMGVWRFAANQFDYLGNDNSNISSSYEGWIDLFGWGTGNNPTLASTNESDYSSFKNWGDNAISNGGNITNSWKTMSYSQWEYVFDLRSGLRYAKARVNDVNGVILLPDNWNSNNFSLNSCNNESAGYRSNIINSTQWATLEQFGAVFLPAAGCRGGTNVYDVGSLGLYWSSSEYWPSSQYDGRIAYYVFFSDSKLSSYHYYRTKKEGKSVRLVQYR